MCHLFARATKAVSICPPDYADLACERERCYLSGVFDPATPGGSVVSGSTEVTAMAAAMTITRECASQCFISRLY
jgi:eukaryotic translation initiation factor 2C